MSSIADRIKQFKDAGAKEVRASFAPTVFLTNGEMVKDKSTGKKKWEGQVLYLEGTLVSRAIVKVGENKKPVYTLILKETDAPVKSRTDIGGGKKEYVDATVKPGDEVAIFAPAQLDRALEKSKAGSNVLIVYRGQETVKTKYGAKDTHQFDVLDAQNGDKPMVTTDRTETEAEPAASAAAPTGKAANDDADKW